MSAYLVPDLLATGLKLVFCGTAPSAASAQAKAYYAKPGNRFWSTLHRVGLTPVQLAPQQYPRLLDYNIGLTDLCKTISGNDDELPEGALDNDALTHKIKTYQPALVAFTSKLPWAAASAKVPSCTLGCAASHSFRAGRP